MTMSTSFHAWLPAFLTLLICQLCLPLPNACVVCSDHNRKQESPCALSLDKCGPCLDNFFAAESNGESCVSLDIVEQPKEIVVEPEGSTVELSCVFNAEVECVWEKDEQLLAIHEPSRIAYKSPARGRKRKDCSLLIYGLTSSEVGQWQCSHRVTSSSHHIASTVSHVDILQKVHVNPNQFQNVTYGSTVQLECIFDREVECGWQRKSRHDHDSRTISIEDRYEYVHAEHEHSCCTLSILKLAAEDEGEWTCVGIRSGHRVESTSAEVVGHPGSGVYGASSASTLPPLQFVTEIRQVTRIKWITKVQLVTREQQSIVEENQPTTLKADTTSGEVETADSSSSGAMTIALLITLVVLLAIATITCGILYFRTKLKGGKEEKDQADSRNAVELKPFLPPSDNNTLGQLLSPISPPKQSPSEPQSLASTIPEANGETLRELPPHNNPQPKTNSLNQLNGSSIVPLDNSSNESGSERDVSQKVRYILLLDLNGNKRSNFFNLVLSYYAYPDPETAKKSELKVLANVEIKGTNGNNSCSVNEFEPRVFKRDNCVFLCTPGLSESADERQRNILLKEKLSEVFANYEELSAICLFLDADWSTKRNLIATHSFLQYFHQSAMDNIVFVLTDELGQTTSPSADILKAINRFHPDYPNRTNVFHFKNTLLSLMANALTDMQWEQSVEELNRMMRYVKRLSAISLTDTTLFNEAKDMVEHLDKAIEELLDSLEKNQKAKSRMDRERGATFDKDIEELRANAYELKEYRSRLRKYVRQNAIVLTNGHPSHLRPKVRRQQSVLEQGGQVGQGEEERVMAKEVRDVIEKIRDKKIFAEDIGPNHIAPR